MVVRALMESQSLARGSRIHPSDCYAQQDKNCREHNLTLRGSPWHVQILLHPQLDLPIQIGRQVLPHPDPLWLPPDQLLLRFPLQILHRHQGGQERHRAPHLSAKHPINIKSSIADI